MYIVFGTLEKIISPAEEAFLGVPFIAECWHMLNIFDGEGIINPATIFAILFGSELFEEYIDQLIDARNLQKIDYQHLPMHFLTTSSLSKHVPKINRIINGKNHF
ncbi:hypothetical protein ACJX0J_014723 [Zea mays]